MTTDTVTQLKKDLEETKQALAKSQTQLELVKKTVKDIIHQMKEDA